MKQILFWLIHHLDLFSFPKNLQFVHSLSDNAKNATPGQLAGLGSLLVSAGWGALQNFLPLTPPTVAGPGVIDSGEYLHKIATAGSPEAANRAAAQNFYGMLLPGLGETMGPMVDSMLNLGQGSPAEGGSGSGSSQGSSQEGGPSDDWRRRDEDE